MSDQKSRKVRDKLKNQAADEFWNFIIQTGRDHTLRNMLGNLRDGKEGKTKAEKEMLEGYQQLDEKGRETAEAILVAGVDKAIFNILDDIALMGTILVAVKSPYSDNDWFNILLETEDFPHEFSKRINEISEIEPKGEVVPPKPRRRKKDKSKSGLFNDEQIGLLNRFAAMLAPLLGYRPDSEKDAIQEERWGIPKERQERLKEVHAEFGELFTSNLRDSGIFWTMDMYRGKNDPTNDRASRRLMDYIMRDFSERQKNIIDLCVRNSVDTAAHYFLWELEQRPEFKIVFEECDGTLYDISKGSINQFCTDPLDWFPEYSKYPASDLVGYRHVADFINSLVANPDDPELISIIKEIEKGG